MSPSLRFLLLPSLGAAALVALPGCGRQTAATAPIVTVPVAAAETADLANDLVLSAEFRPYQEIDVMAKVAGYVREIRVDIGDRVKAGDILAVLEIPEISDEVSKARAAVGSAQAAADIARLSADRLRQVARRDQGLVPQQDLDAAQARDRQAAATLASARSALQSAQAMLAYATIRAPFSGVVTRRYADVGALIQAGTASQTQAMPVVKLAQNDPLRLVLPVPVSAADKVRVGQEVEVKAAGHDLPGQARVSRFAESLDFSTRTMRAEVDVPNADRALLPGMYAQVRLHLAAHAAALSVPLDAIDGIGTAMPQAYVVRDGLVHVVAVTVGLETASRIEVLSGLARGDRVIVGRHGGLYEGEQVQARPAAYETASNG